MTADTSIDTWLQALPKVELHIHLEGSIPLPALWLLVEKYGGTADVPTLADLEARFEYRDFPHFIEMWMWKNRFLRTAEDFTFIAEAVAADLARQNIRYAEMFYSPPDFAATGLEPGAITEAVRAGLDRVRNVRIALVADLVRDYGPHAGARTLDAIAEVQHLGVIGIGIGGSEQKFPPEPFAAIYERARSLGFRTSAHAGEAAGADSIWGAICALRVDRIGHGTRAIEDPALMEHLAKSQLPVEMCPISNVRTAVVPDLAAHPIRTCMDKGLLITVNTDDPAMFQTALAEEYRQLMSVHGLGRADVVRLVDNAIQASWLDDASKAALRSELHAAAAA